MHITYPFLSIAAAMLLSFVLPAHAGEKECAKVLHTHYTPEQKVQIAKKVQEWTKVTLAMPRSRGYSVRKVEPQEYTLRQQAYDLRRDPLFRSSMNKKTNKFFAEWDALDEARERAALIKARVEESEKRVNFPSFTERYVPKLEEPVQNKQDVAFELLDHVESMGRMLNEQKPEEAALAEKVRAYALDAEFLAMLPVDLAARVPALLRNR